jgi:flagellin-like hook-associated protein FlgL
MEYIGLNRYQIHTIDQTSLMNSMNTNTRSLLHKTTDSSFVQKNTNDYNISNVITNKNAAYQYKHYSKIKKSLSDDLAEYQTAQNNFESIKSKVGEIKSLLKSAHNGTLTGTALDDAQNQINNLVGGINSLVEITTVGGNKVFDGTFKQNLQENLSGDTTLRVDFSRAGDVSRPLAVTASMTPTANGGGLQVLYSDSKYIVASTQYSTNGEASSADFGKNGSVQIYDAQTKNLIREIQSPLTTIDNERFGYTVSVNEDKILIGTRNQGFWDGNGDWNNDYLEYDRDFSGGAFLYDIPSGNLITSFTKDALAAKNPLVDLGIRSENDINTNYTSVNKFTGFGDALQIQGDRVFISKTRNAGSDNRPGGQGALAATGIQEFTLDGTFVKQHDISVNTWQSVDSFQVTDDYIIVSNGLTSSPDFSRDGSITFLDRDTGFERTLKSSDPGSYKTFGSSSYVQGKQLIVGEALSNLGNIWDGTTLIGYATPEGNIDLATWNARQNNGGGFNGFGGAAYLYDIDKMMTEYDTAYNAAITGGQTVAQAQTAATAMISSNSSDGLIRSFDKTTLAAQGLDIDTYDRFGFKVKLDGTNAIITSALDDSAGVNSGATYIFDTTTGELVTKANSIKYQAAAGDKLYQVSGSTIQEYDFSSVLGAPINGLNIDTASTKASSLGSKSSRALNDFTVSANIASLGGSIGLVDNQSLVDIDEIESNLTRMRASLNSMVKRVSNSLDRIDDKMNILQNNKATIDLNLGRSFNATNLDVQIADRRKMVDLLP